MINVMIVDDDHQVRERLRSIIEWDQLSVKLICEAADSDTAREKYLLYRPKIIITDIKIPIISGLELANELSQIDPELRFIVITGYCDFYYAQQSVKIGAVDLLLKPILPESINESITKAVAFFENKKRDKASISALQQLLNKNLPKIRDSYLANLIQFVPDSEKIVSERLSQLGLNFSSPSLTVAIATIGSPPSKKVNLEAVNLLLRDTAKQLFNDAGFEFYTFFDSHFRLNCIMGWNFHGGDDAAEEVLNKLNEQLHFMTDCCVYAGIGRMVTSPAKLYRAGREAKEALSYQSVLNDDVVIHYKNIERFEGSFRNKDTLLSYLMQKFRANDYDLLADALTRYTTRMQPSSIPGQLSFRDFIFEYVTTLASECLRLDVRIETLESYAALFNRLLISQDIHDQLDYVLELTRKLMALLFEKRNNNKNHLISQAKEFISKNLPDASLSLDTVSEHIGLSRIYLCKLFHKQEGITFNNYLKQVRIEHAKELLQNTTLKVFEISDMCGFANAKYFSYVFRQLTGMSPLEYQKSMV